MKKADMKISEYNELELLRGDLSRADFLRLLFLRHRPVSPRQALDCSAPGGMIFFAPPGISKSSQRRNLKGGASNYVLNV